MPNPTTPEMMPTKAQSSPNVLEWILVALVLISLVGVGFLYMSLERLNASMVSTNAEVMEVKQKLMEQKEGVKDDDVLDSEGGEPRTNTYTNAHYQFALDVPFGLEYCLNDFCQNDVTDLDIQFFEINGSQLARYAGGLPTDDTGLIYLTISPVKNALGMSAVEFAKRSLELNQQYRPRGGNYTDEIETIFAGEPAYAFTATDGFEERGLSYSLVDGEPVVQDDSRFYEKAGLGITLAVPHRIIYLDHNGTFYRIMYPRDHEIAKTVINSFRFLP